MNPPTTPPTATVPQWMKDAAEEHVQATINTCRTTSALVDSLAAIIAKHAPSHVSDGAYVTAITGRNEARQERDAARAELAALRTQYSALQTALGESLTMGKKPATPAPSIWRPVSVKPTREDGNKHGYMLLAGADGSLAFGPISMGDSDRMMFFAWTRTADLLAACPLPVIADPVAEALTVADTGDRTESDPLVVLADEVRRLRATAQGGKE